MKELNNTIDCIFDIRDKYVVLIKRDHEPYKGFWALPGGRQLVGESLDQTVVREVREETGLVMKIVSGQLPTPVKVLGQQTFLEQVRTYNSGTDPRGGNTTVYAVQLDIDPRVVDKALRNGDDAKDIGIFRLNELPELAFDHEVFLYNYFKKLKRYKNPFPTSDIIIEYDGGIVLVERKNPPHGLAIPGGFAEWGLSLEENAVKEAKEETGLDIVIENPEAPLCVHSDPNRDPRTHVLSVTYIAKGFGKLQAGDDAKAARVYTINQVMQLIERDGLAFDHAKILTKYLKHRGYLK